MKMEDQETITFKVKTVLKQ